MYMYGSLHIAFVGGLAFFFNNYNRYTNHKEEFYLSIMIALSIFIYYNICRIYEIKEYEKTENNELLNWISKNLTELIFSISFALILLIILFLKLKIEIYTKFWFIPICILILIYFPIRKIAYLRNLIIGFTWMFVIDILQTHSFFEINFVFPYHLIIGLYLSIISYIYDKIKLKKVLFFIDLLILLPYLFFFLISQSMNGLD